MAGSPGAGALPAFEYANGQRPAYSAEGLASWDLVDEDFLARTRPLIDRARLEARRWQEEADVALAEVADAERELGALKQRSLDMRARAQARKEQQHQDAMTQAAQAAAEMTKVRVAMQEAMANSRLERRQLQEELVAKRLAAERHEHEVQELASAAGGAISQAAKRAATLLRSAQPGEGNGAIFSTIDWLEAVARAANELPAGTRSAVEAVRGCASLMLEQWIILARAARQGSLHAAKEEDLVQQLHATRSRCCALRAELASRTREVTELQESLDLEIFRADVARQEQNWFVPRAASTLQALEADTGRLPAPPPGCENGWPWEIPLEEIRPRHPTASPAWAGYRCDRSPNHRRP
eukprot:TRINITY_DN23504_c0_g1_i1.p1 TRINITY_DN23504_c0_g1~~TRINITY_DN23504_c0_g1_i1.p1  ORF type:complete len:372 (+),score=81.47 TRINITY_DN23504_c0_g1_i1:54-1118(+)